MFIADARSPPKQGTRAGGGRDFGEKTGQRHPQSMQRCIVLCAIIHKWFLHEAIIHKVCKIARLHVVHETDQKKYISYNNN